MQLHEPAAPIFAALGDPTRLHLLARLGRGEASLSTLAAGTGMTRQAVTKHLDVLARAGLVRHARFGRERRYRADVAPLAEAADWIASWRTQWEASFDRLADYLDTLPKEAPR